MDPRQLEYFVRVATCGGFQSRCGGAPDSAIGVEPPHSPPRRGTWRVTAHSRPTWRRATPAGELLLDRAEAILRQIRDARDEVASEAKEPRGELAIGMPPSLQSMITVPLLAELPKRLPSVSVKAWVATSMVLREMVLSGNLDLAVFGIIEADTTLDLMPLLRDDMFLVGPADANLAAGKPPSWAEIAELPVILTSRPNSVRLLVEAAAAKRRRKLNVIMEVNYIPAQIELVRCGTGFTMLPYSAVREHADRGELSVARNSGSGLRLGRSRRRGKPVSAAARSAQQLLAEIARRRIVDEQWPHARLIHKASRSSGLEEALL